MRRERLEGMLLSFLCFRFLVAPLAGAAQPLLIFHFFVLDSLDDSLYLEFTKNYVFHFFVLDSLICCSEPDMKMAAFISLF